MVANGRTERVGERDTTFARGHRETGHAAARTFDRQLEWIALDRRQGPEHDVDRLELPERSQQESPAAHHQVVALDDVIAQRRRKVRIFEVLDGIDAGDEDDDPGADSIGRSQRRQRLAQALPPFRLSHRRHDGCCFGHCARGDDTVEGGVAEAGRNVDVVADSHEVARLVAHDIDRLQRHRRTMRGDRPACSRVARVAQHHLRGDDRVEQQTPRAVQSRATTASESRMRCSRPALSSMPRGRVETIRNRIERRWRSGVGAIDVQQLRRALGRDEAGGELLALVQIDAANQRRPGFG